MRKLLISALAAAIVLPTASDAFAQQRRGGDQGEQERRRRTQREFEAPQARLDNQGNFGPCPFVKVLYDAARYVEFAGAAEAAAQVAYTGEIQGVEANCRYTGDDPIRVNVDVLFALGKGPQARADSNSTAGGWPSPSATALC
jgi:hypothetical protein